MGGKELALRRMDEITEFYAKKSGVDAIMGFGSLADLNRFDEYSDLDFLVLCTENEKQRLLEEIVELSSVSPIVYSAIEGEDTVKILFEDGVLCDYGIVTEKQLKRILHPKGRFLWKSDSFCETYIQSNLIEHGSKKNQQYIGRILIEVYVGLLRELRGEKAAAFEKIQYEVAQLLLRQLYEEKKNFSMDYFSALRRIEKSGAKEAFLCQLLPGYAKNIEAAKTILSMINIDEKTCGLYREIQKLLIKIENR